jgi:pyridoxal phosphate-dependent aminotransferase EpsN
MRERLHLSPPHLTGDELAAVAEAFATRYVAPVGPMVDRFEREFAACVGLPHAVAVSSGTAALHLALRLLDVGPGDEVLCSDLTFVASVAPAVQLGARPCFLDADEATWTLDPGLLEEELAGRERTGRLPRAVIAVDLYGQCCDYSRIRASCRQRGVPLLEDAAEALGATERGRHAGAAGDLAAYSFNGNKVITTSGGGMLASADEAWIRRARSLAAQAREPAVHYEHRELGYNYRMSNILAAIGCAQLRRLPGFVDRRRAIFERYRSGLRDVPGIGFMPEAAYGRSSRWLTAIRVDPVASGFDREALRLALEEGNIESRPVWKPMHMQPVFAGAAVRGGSVARTLFDQGLCLPSGSAMADADVDRVIETILRRAGALA